MGTSKDFSLDLCKQVTSFGVCARGDERTETRDDKEMMSGVDMSALSYAGGSQGTM